MRTSVLALMCLAAIACGKKNPDSAPPSETTAALTTPALTEAQKSEGWRALFDGKSLGGWQFFKGRPNNTWEAAGGILHCKAIQEGVSGVGDQRSDLITTDEFENFELAFDWKLAAEGNTGVMFRVTEEFEQPYFSGPEYQIIDEKNYPNEIPVHFTGANYGVHSTTNKMLKPVGEWNSSKIVVNKSHVEHWLNGQKIVEYDLWSDDWKKRVADSKWKEFPGYGMTRTGHIALQDHGSEAWFRNILIKPL